MKKYLAKRFMPNESYRNGKDRVDPNLGINHQKHTLKRQEMRDGLPGTMEKVTSGKELAIKLKNDEASRSNASIDKLIGTANDVKNWLWRYRNYLGLSPAAYDTMAKGYSTARNPWEKLHGNRADTTTMFAMLTSVSGMAPENVREWSNGELAAMKLNIIKAAQDFLEQADQKLQWINQKISLSANLREAGITGDVTTSPGSQEVSPVSETQKKINELKENLTKFKQDVENLKTVMREHRLEGGSNPTFQKRDLSKLVANFNTATENLIRYQNTSKSMRLLQGEARMRNEKSCKDYSELLKGYENSCKEAINRGNLIKKNRDLLEKKVNKVKELDRIATDLLSRMESSRTALPHYEDSIQEVSENSKEINGLEIYNANISAMRAKLDDELIKQQNELFAALDDMMEEIGAMQEIMGQISKTEKEPAAARYYTLFKCEEEENTDEYSPMIPEEVKFINNRSFIERMDWTDDMENAFNESSGKTAFGTKDTDIEKEAFEYINKSGKKFSAIKSDTGLEIVWDVINYEDDIQTVVKSCYRKKWTPDGQSVIKVNEWYTRAHYEQKSNAVETINRMNPDAVSVPIIPSTDDQSHRKDYYVDETAYLRSIRDRLSLIVENEGANSREIVQENRQAFQKVLEHFGKLRARIPLAELEGWLQKIDERLNKPVDKLPFDFFQ